jgi:hypothetical protein
MVSLLLVVGALAAKENAGTKKDGAKAKREYTLGYGYGEYPAPFIYDHDTIAHAPIVHHAPLAPAITHPVIPAVHAPLVAPLAKTSVIHTSTGVHHSPFASYFSAVHSPIVAPSAAYVAHHPATFVEQYHHHPLLTEFHRR